MEPQLEKWFPYKTNVYFDIFINFIFIFYNKKIHKNEKKIVL